jgi:hypothetical protein
MKTLITLAALLALSGCAGQPMSPDEQARLGAFFTALSGAAAQQQADTNADFYYRQQYYQQVEQTGAMQNVSNDLYDIKTQQRQNAIEQRGAQGWY